MSSETPPLLSIPENGLFLLKEGQRSQMVEDFGKYGGGERANSCGPECFLRPSSTT